MKSKALHHYPQIVFKNGTKMLWNPILKQSFVNRPEERVRLSFVEYLIHEAKFSSSRISFESPLKLPGDKGSSRTDIICYNKSFDVDLLVECKATSIPINEKVAQQIGRYNQALGAPYLMITNGIEDIWFKDNDTTMDHISELPETYSSTNATFERDLEYWKSRGFLGNKDMELANNQTQAFLNELYASANTDVRFLSLGLENGFYADTYYGIIPTAEDLKLAIAFSSTPQQETLIHIVVNSAGVNKAFLTLNRTQFMSGGNTMVYMLNEKGTTEIDGQKHIHDLQNLSLQSFISSIQDMLKLYS